jgi:2-haloacid dehalogenase
MNDIKVCVFDAYGTLFDFNSAVARHRAEIGPQADRLAQMWREKQIGYTWARSLMGKYAPFWQVTGEALAHCLQTCGLPRDGALHEKLMRAYLVLDPFPEVRSTLDALHAAEMPLAILSNGNLDMLEAVVRNTGLADYFNALLSVEAVKIFKPDPRVYRLVTDHFAVAPANVCFLSSNGWDAHGAASFGFRTLWVNRADAAPEGLPGTPSGELRTLAELPTLVLP